MLLADLHLHSPHTGGVSRKISLECLVKWAKLKGLNLIAIPDAVYPPWRESLSPLEQENGLYTLDGVYLIPTSEIETKDRVHHVLVFPSLSEAGEMWQRLRNPRRGGRPRVDMDGEELARLAEELDVLIFPAHAFTPYFSLYAHHDSLSSCYGSMTDYIRGMELGLSADTSLALLIPETHRLAYFSFSDAHSCRKIGREFTALDARPTLSSVLRALREGRVLFNAGLHPREGKYHLTACNRCYRYYSLREAQAMKWRCPCGGSIKKGVRDRILELSRPREPPEKPPYYHVVPLEELFRILGRRDYEEFLRSVPEIHALLLEPLENLPSDLRPYVQLIREDQVVYVPGGGGKYGEPLFILDPGEREKKRREIEEMIPRETQRTLFEF